MVAGDFLQKSKKRKSLIAAIGLPLFLLGFAACGKKPVDPGIPLKEVILEYPVDNPIACAGTEDGSVYIINLERMEGGDSEYQLHHFDEQGQQDWYIGFGNDYSMVETLALSEDGKQLYFTAQGDGVEPCLFSCSVENYEINMLCRMSHFEQIKQLVVVGDMVYLLGKSPGWQERKPPDSGYSFSGERLVAYCCDSGEQLQLGFDFPVSMSASGVGTLMVFGYLDGDGYCMMEYDPAKDSVQVISRLDHYKFDCFVACNGGKDVIYDYGNNWRGLVLSDVRELSLETELYPDGMTTWTPPGYAAGRVYCADVKKRCLISFPLDAVRKNNREITFVSTENGTLNAPYGCGYSIRRMELSEEKFTLKILAGDQDFDLCMGSSLFGSGRSLRENGIFYPLNDVPEIEEYLDRCFPYVREAATKEDGTIWMLPVKVNIFGMVVRQGAAEKAGLSLHSGMTWEEFAQEIQKTKENDRKWMNIRPSFMVLAFEYQYFTRFHTLEGELFPGTCQVLSEIGRSDWGWEATDDKFIVDAVGGPAWLEFFLDSLRQQYGEDAVYIALPKLYAEDGNIANCVFLAVNPDSGKRDEALAYLAALAKYLSQEGELPFFKDWQGEGILDETLHEVYEDGKVGFALDDDVYGEGFDELFSGELSLAEYIRMTEPKLRMYWIE